MPNYYVEYTLTGPTGSVVVPNLQNPLPAADLADLLRKVADGLPDDMVVVEVTGLTARKVEESPP